MSITPGVTINLTAGKCSHILLSDGSGPFKAGTRIVSVKDLAHDITFAPKKNWRNNPTKFSIRLKAPARIRPLDPPPETGTITITLANPTATINIDVGYVDDDET